MKDRLITVTATATDKFAPDCAKISALAECRGEYRQATEGAHKLARTAESIFEAVGAETRSGGMRVSELRDKDGKLEGYRACIYVNGKLMGESDIGKALEYFGKSGLNWQLSYALENKAHGEELIARAVKNARAKAQTIAEAAGVRLGKLVSVDYAEGGGAVMYARAAATHGVPEQITLSETVICAYAIED